MIDLQVIFLFLIGISIGSFLNVLIDRIPSGISPIYGRSKCDFCHKTLPSFDLIPLFSFFYLKGRCRFCRKRLSWQYPFIEALSGIILIAVYFLFHDNWWMVIFNSVLLYSFLVIFVTDLKYRIIPDEINISLLILIVINIIVGGGSVRELLFAFISGFIFFLFFMLLFIVTKGRGIGLGDAKLSFVIGFLLGFPKVVVAFYLAFLTGAFISLILILMGKKTMKSKIAFGPFLVYGTLVSFFFGSQILDIFKKLLFL